MNVYFSFKIETIKFESKDSNLLLTPAFEEADLKEKVRERLKQENLIGVEDSLFFRMKDDSYLYAEGMARVSNPDDKSFGFLDVHFGG